MKLMPSEEKDSKHFEAPCRQSTEEALHTESETPGTPAL